MVIACCKGLLAGVCNTALAVYMGAQQPEPAAVISSMAVGFLGYGLSLTLFVVGLRTLGTARTGAYFSVAPLFGVALSLDRKSTRLNSSHLVISYAVFCLKKKKRTPIVRMLVNIAVLAAGFLV